MPTIPTLQEAQNLFPPVPKATRALQQRKRDARRTTYFCIGYSKAWKVPIWKIIQNLIQTKYPSLKWIRVSMSYHRFTNLREIFNGDMMTKLNADIVSLDFTTRECNCQTKATTGCNYNNHCRQPIVVYEARRNRIIPGYGPKAYIGVTQQFLKKRMQSHVSETRGYYQYLQNLRGKPKNTDTFARFFAVEAMISGIQNPTTDDIRSLYTLNILWQGDPIRTVKTFGTNHCILCNQERLEIFKRMRTKPNRLINDQDEIFNTCRHKPRFHRFARATQVRSSTDEGSIPEKVPCVVEV